MNVAQLDSQNTITNIIVVDDPSQWSGYMPVPDDVGIDWSTPDGGITWNPPSLPPPPAETAAMTQTQADQTVQQLLIEQGPLNAQIQADANLWATTTPGTPLTQAHLDALGRMVDGFTTVMEALQAHMIITGVVPPAPPAPGP